MALKIAIVGCGKIADGHVEEIKKTPGAALTAVCDIEPIMAEQLAVRYGIDRRYSNFDEMLDREAPDVVHITTPPQAHAALATRAMDAGCHVYLEKPLAPDAAGARQIVEHAIRTGRKMTINYWPNFDPPALELKQLQTNGVLGDVVHVESHFGYALTGDFGTALLGDSGHWVHKLPGKLFHNVLDHIVNKIMLFVSDARPRVLVHAYRRRAFSGNPTLDNLYDELRFIVGGEKVSGYGTFCAHALPVGHHLRVYGTRNTAHVDYRTRTVTLESEQTVPSALGRLFPAFAQGRQYMRAGMRNVRRFARSEFHYFSGMHTLIGEFYRSVREGGPAPIEYSEILRTAEVMDGIIAQVNQAVASRGAAE
jgi:predicted dehydrogenase